MAALMALAGSGTAATSSTVVSATVPSATSLIATGCASGVAGRTDFGIVTPGSSVTTTSDCSVAFGSSNDSSQLRMAQGDLLGTAMYSPTWGALDTAFDGDGRVVTATGPAAAYDIAYSVSIQQDGKIVTGGYCDMGLATGNDACLARYLANGALDTSFDGDGRATTAIAPGAGSDFIDSGALQADGKILLAGYCDMGAATGYDACLARFNSNGSLDTTFDGDGRLTTVTAPGAGTDYVVDIKVLDDGRILTSGYCDMGAATGLDACLARYRSDGSLDSSFDTDGRVTTAIGPGAAADSGFKLALQPDGRIIASGWCDMGGATGTDACLVRFNTDGSLDTSFDGDGRVTSAVGPGAAFDSAYDVSVQSDGRLVTAGYCYMGAVTGNDACLMRFNANGSLDTSFDADGRVTTAYGPGASTDYAGIIDVQADGKIVAGGACDMAGATGYDSCLSRYNPNGSLDTSFDGDGRVTTATAPGTGGDYPNVMAFQSDGRIVTAGHCEMGLLATGDDVCLASYDENGLVSQYADDGVSDWDTAGTSPRLFGACLRAVSGGATAQWATSATCPAVDGTYWNAIPTALTKVAYNTALEPDPADATASFRFGMRTSGNQPPGSYVAPITFEVLAPNA